MKGHRQWRWAGRAGVVIVLGALTTLVVAWGLAFTDVGGQPMSARAGLVRDDGLFKPMTHIRTTVLTRWKGVGSSVYLTEPALGSWMPPTGEETDGPTPESLTPWYVRGVVWPRSSRDVWKGLCVTEVRGWPFPAMSTVRERWGQPDSRTRGLVLWDGLTWSFGGGQHKAVVAMPWRPIWLGFAGNTAVHACAWAMLLFGVNALRSRRRARAHLCRECAYDLRGTPAGKPCPECGSAPTGDETPKASRAGGWAARALILFALGGATTAAVAWALALRDAPGWLQSTRDLETYDSMIVDVGSGFGVSVFYRMDVLLVDAGRPFPNPAPEDVTPWYMRDLVLKPLDGMKRKFEGLFVDARGWPLRALCSTRESAFDTRRPRESGITLPERWELVTGGLPQHVERVALPLRPIWAGLVVNTGFFAALWGVPLWAVRTLRRRRR